MIGERDDVREFARELDVDSARVYAIPMSTRFRGIDVREGVLFEGPAGWGEFCPFPEYGDDAAVAWLLTALESAVVGWPPPLRESVAVNVTVPAVGPERARAVVLASGCATAKVKVADHPGSLAEDLARLEAVRDALGPAGAVRVDANGAWDVDTAVGQLEAMDAAAGGLQYAEQPCRSIEELAAVRRRTGVPIAADESIRNAADPERVAVAAAADVAVLKCAPLGGVRRALDVAAAAGLPTVVSSALETSVGMAAGVAFAGALPRLELACGLGTLALLEGDVVDAGASLRAQNGRLRVPSRPPVPSPDLLDRYAIRDPDRRRWWTDRLRRTLGLVTGRDEREQPS